jgi:hypothetical protein
MDSPVVLRKSCVLVFIGVAIRFLNKGAQDARHEVCGVRRWALDVQARSNHNKAACALANKLARICYATLRDKEPFGEAQQLNKKINRESFVMPA